MAQHPHILLDRLGPDRPVVMGVLNVTPDSFSDGGLYVDLGTAVRRAEKMLVGGAAIIDVGGESTRPGAADVAEQAEIERVVPVIEAIRKISDVPLSVDTSKPAVMRAAAGAGASMLNDVRALQAPGALEAAAELGLPVCLMHMQGQPRNMQSEPRYDDVVTDVAGFLRERMAACIAGGIPRENIVLDPGFGFGKTHAHNLELLARLAELTDLGRPLLVGLSRKSTLGALTGKDVDDRLGASIAAAVIAVMAGAAIIRAHDVEETVDALRVTAAIVREEQDL